MRARVGSLSQVWAFVGPSRFLTYRYPHQYNWYLHVALFGFFGVFGVMKIENGLIYLS